MLSVSGLLASVMTHASWTNSSYPEPYDAAAGKQDVKAEIARGGACEPFVAKAPTTRGGPGPGAYIDQSKRELLASATSTTTPLSYTTIFRTARPSGFSLFSQSSRTCSPVAAPVFYPPPTSSSLNHCRLPIGPQHHSDIMRGPPHNKATNPARKGLGLDPDALDHLPSLQPGTAQEERVRRTQARAHSRSAELAQNLARADAQKTAPPAATTSTSTSTSTTDARVSRKTRDSGAALDHPDRASRAKPSRSNVAVKSTVTPNHWEMPLSSKAAQSMLDDRPGADDRGTNGLKQALTTTTTKVAPKPSKINKREMTERVLADCDTLARANAQAKALSEQIRNRTYETREERLARLVEEGRIPDSSLALARFLVVSTDHRFSLAACGVFMMHRQDSTPSTVASSRTRSRASSVHTSHGRDKSEDPAKSSTPVPALPRQPANIPSSSRTSHGTRDAPHQIFCLLKSVVFFDTLGSQSDRKRSKSKIRATNELGTSSSGSVSDASHTATVSDDTPHDQKGVSRAASFSSVRSARSVASVQRAATIHKSHGVSTKHHVANVFNANDTVSVTGMREIPCSCPCLPPPFTGLC